MCFGWHWMTFHLHLKSIARKARQVRKCFLRATAGIHLNQMSTHNQIGSLQSSEATTLGLHELVDLSQSSKRSKDHRVPYGSIWLMAQIMLKSNKWRQHVCYLQLKCPGLSKKLMPFVVLGQLLLASLSVQSWKLGPLKMLKSFSLREVLLLICCSHLAERKFKHVNSCRQQMHANALKVVSYDS